MPASTVMPDVVVEIAFTTGPNDPAPVWVDVSSEIEAESIITIVRGRQDELGDVQPSRCTLTLDNRDGRFTPANTAGAYYPNVKKGRRIRVSSTWPLSGSPVTYRRFSGYIDEWPVDWPDGTDKRSTVTVTASSRLARLGRGSELRSIVEEEFLEDSPAAYYPFGDPEGTTQAGNVSVTVQPPMTAVHVGTGGSITFGSATGPGTDGLTAALFSSSGSNFSYMRARFDQPVVTASHTTLTLECFFLSSNATGQELVRLDQVGSGGAFTSLYILPASMKLFAEGWGSSSPPNYLISSAVAVNDGATHHALVRETISGGNLTATLYLDGVQVDTTTVAIGSFGSRDQLSAGGSARGVGAFIGTLSHIAVTPGTTEMTAARIDVHADSGLNGFSGESSNARIVRLARFAGVPSAEVSTETGLSTSMANQVTNGKTALELMNEVATTEGGLLFDARDGTLTFHARSHRYNASSALTLSATAGEIEASLEPKLDDQGLVNDMTASRDSGIAVRAVDETSIDDYGLYRDSVELFTTSDNEVQDAANWKVFTASTPQVRVPSAEVDLLNSSSAQKTALLAREIGDQITLSNLPSQAPASSMSFFIEGYTETIGPESYTIAFNLSPAGQVSVWQLDSSTYSVLNSTTRLGY